MKRSTSKQPAPQETQLPSPISQLQPEPDVQIKIRIGEVEAESGFTIAQWERAKTEPSAAQFIVGSLIEALTTNGHE